MCIRDRIIGAVLRDDAHVRFRAEAPYRRLHADDVLRTVRLARYKVGRTQIHIAHRLSLIHIYTNEYYNQDNTLILSARIDGKRIEAVELSLDTFKVVQSSGVCNSNTEYHDGNINLVESNAELIRQRMNKAA